MGFNGHLQLKLLYDCVQPGFEAFHLWNSIISPLFLGRNLTLEGQRPAYLHESWLIVVDITNQRR